MASKASKVRWLDEPAEKDYAAAERFLSMLVEPSSLAQIIAAMRTAPMSHWAAKDILRAAELPPLTTKQSDEVAGKLREVSKDIPLSPVLLIGGIRPSVVIADGYHRASAAYGVDQGLMVPGRLLWWPAIKARRW